jgi:DNA-binding GntR family transcriptional regulator
MSATEDVEAAEDPGSNVEAVYRRLRAAILADELPAGARLSQVQLAVQFNMSRGPLREALRLLERDGLIEATHRRMVRVAAVSFSDLDQVYALRIVNEALAVQLSTPLMLDTDIATLQGLVAAMDRCAEQHDVKGWETDHRNFHLLLYGGAGERMLRLIRELFDHTERYRRIYHSEAPRDTELAATEHRNIAEACANRDAVGASTLLARHVARTALTVFARTAPEYEPVLVREATRFVTQSAPQ